MLAITERNLFAHTVDVNQYSIPFKMPSRNKIEHRHYYISNFTYFFNTVLGISDKRTKLTYCVIVLTTGNPTSLMLNYLLQIKKRLFYDIGKYKHVMQFDSRFLKFIMSVKHNYNWNNLNLKQINILLNCVIFEFSFEIHERTL